MDVRFSPQPWTRATTPREKRRRAPYRSSYTQTLDKLEGELRKLKATEILIEASFNAEQIRLDGWPRKDQRPQYNGVIVSFNMPGVGRVEYACDSCLAYEDNLHSIALTLEALRSLERYGAVFGQQQYTGFRAIGSGAVAMSNGKMSKAAAASFVTEHSGRPEEAFGMVLRDPDVAEKLYRIAAKRLHPDAGGSTELFQRLQEAKRVLSEAS